MNAPTPQQIARIDLVQDWMKENRHFFRDDVRGLDLSASLALMLEEHACTIGKDVLKLANRHGNIKPRTVNEYFAFEHNDNAARFVK